MIKKIQTDLQEAMKGKESARVSALRLLLSDLRNAEFGKRAALEKAEMIRVLKQGIKTRREAAELYRKGNRPDLAEKEEREIEVFQGYLPPQLTEAEVDQMVTAAIASLGLTSKSDLGRLMKHVMEEYGGRVEGKVVQQIAVRKLSIPPPVAE